MKTHLVTAALWTFALSTNAETLSLSGSDWHIHDDQAGRGAEEEWFNPSVPADGWIAAHVPGNIQADVETAHLLRPLWYGGIDTNLYEVARKDWWYRKDLVVPASFAGKRLTLVFDGVDERCRVWWNGQQLGTNAGMFRRFSFDVSAVAEPGRTNHLALWLGRMPDELMPWMINSDGPDIPGQKYWFLNGIHRTRQILKDLKTTGNWGWDWSVNLWTLGIWKNVRLEATGPARIEWTRVETKLTENLARATVHVSLDINSSVETAANFGFRIFGHGTPLNTSVVAALKKGHNVVKAEVQLDRPALWWPNGHGEQPLYTLEVTVACEGGTSDVRTTRFGIRDIRWEHTEGAPADFPAAYQMVINHRPVRTLGTGVILPYALPGCGLAHELQLLRLAKAADMNLIRINGGGGAPLFDTPWYDLADELGIMISYEFPIGNAWNYDEYEKDSVFLANLDTTCRDIIRQSRNHPSIIEYVGGNEMSWSITDTNHPALEVMKRVAAEENDRVFRATCPDAGAKHSPWLFDIRSTYGHYNSVETMRYGEFGTCSPANLETWLRDIPPASRWPINLDDPILIRKNAAQAVFNKNIWSNKKDIEWAFAPDNLPDFIRAGQYLGAEGLRYAYDALRRKGRRIGGMSNHCYSEPWPNAAGSGMVDFDGRTLMNYDFVRQALAPIALSLAFDTMLYTPKSGIKAELFMVSDAPGTATGLKWKWLARDQRGEVFARGDGTADINPIEVKSLAKLELSPAGDAAQELVFVELRLEAADGKLLTERVQVFAPSAARLAGLLGSSSAPGTQAAPELPDGPGNFAFVGNGAKPATASSARPEPKHHSVGINDGNYGNEHSWIGTQPHSWFEIDLGKPARVGRFKLGRDRTGELTDRQPDRVKIETSLDGQTWRPVFEQSKLTTLKDSGPSETTVIEVTPVQARSVRVTVDASPSAPADELSCVDEFEVYAPSKEAPASLPQLRFEKQARVSANPVTRTALQVTAQPMRVDGNNEVYELTVKNAGRMTALLCEPHPLLVYRTDLLVANNNCSIPPGESRVITIRAPRQSESGLSLAQTGWQLSCWNADDVTVAPGADVLLTVGRRDKLCREFAGKNIWGMSNVLSGNNTARFEFTCDSGQAKRPGRLRLHTADQASETPTIVEVTVNERTMERTLPKGLGIQRSDAEHLAFPVTVEFDLSASVLRPGKNALTVRVKGPGWFTWDALDLVSRP